MASDVPGQQFIDAVDRMISDTGQDMTQVCARVDIVQFAAPDERVHRSRPLAPAVRAGEHKIFPSMQICALSQ